MGTVSFFDGVTLLGTATLNGSSQASFTTSVLSVATHNITATYGGDATHSGSTSPVLSQIVASTTAVVPTLDGRALAVLAIFLAVVAVLKLRS